MSYYVVSNDGKWTPMHTVTAGDPGLRNAVYHPDPPAVTPSCFSRTRLRPRRNGCLYLALGVSRRLLPFHYRSFKQLTFNNLQAYPCALDCGGIGAKVYQEKDGVKVWVSIVFHLNNPHIVFGASVGVEV